MMGWKIQKLENAQKEFEKAINTSVSVTDFIGDSEEVTVLLAALNLLRATNELVIIQAKVIDELNEKVDKLIANE